MSVVPQRFDMTAREKMIEEFYLGLLGRALAAKKDNDRLMRVELKRLGDLAKSQHREIVVLSDRVLELRGALDRSVAGELKARRRR